VERLVERGAKPEGREGGSLDWFEETAVLQMEDCLDGEIADQQMGGCRGEEMAGLRKEDYLDGERAGLQRGGCRN